MHRFAIFLIACIFMCCEDTDEGQSYEYHVAPQATGDLEGSSEPHFVYFDTRVKDRGILLVFLGGTDSYPRHYQLFSKTAANLGYHVMNLNYLNGEPVSRCFQAVDETCFSAFHEEVLFGTPGSDFVNVDAKNSIYSRIVLLLTYLDQQYPGQGWAQFYNGAALNHEKLSLAGHSQGGGHAAFFAQKFAIARLILFSAPNDYSEEYGRPALWCTSDFATPASRFFGLLHVRDEIVSPVYQYAVWNAIGVLTASDTVSVEAATLNVEQGLVINYDPNPAAYPRLKHNAPVRDDAVPTGEPGEHLRTVWEYMLGG